MMRYDGELTEISDLSLKPPLSKGCGITLGCEGVCLSPLQDLHITLKYIKNNPCITGNLERYSTILNPN